MDASCSIQATHPKGSRSLAESTDALCDRRERRERHVGRQRSNDLHRAKGDAHRCSWTPNASKGGQVRRGRCGERRTSPRSPWPSSAARRWRNGATAWRISNSVWFNCVVLVGGGASPRETGTLRRRRWRVRSDLLLDGAVGFRRADAVRAEPQRRGQCRELGGDKGSQHSQRGLGLEARAHRAHLGNALGEAFGNQSDDDDQSVMDQPHSMLDPTYGSRELDRIGTKRIGRRGSSRCALGMRHHHFERIEGAGQPRGQTVGQQAEGGVALRTVPASDACPARGLARVGAVACQRTSPVRMIRTPLKACIAPRLGFDVLLAGMPRRVSKLHRPRPCGALP